MPEIIINGSEGRIEGRYQHSEQKGAPVVLILHPHPLYGGTMNNKIVYRLYHIFAQNGFSVLRFNFRGVGKSQGKYDEGCLLYTSPSPRDRTRSRMPSSA